jgi:nucleoside-diphosphate-sugar epimerase
MKVLISGINSFTGVYLESYLSSLGYDVYGLTQDDNAKAKELICDISSYTSVDSAVKKIKPQILIHLAAISFVAHEDKEELYRTNIVGTKNLLEAFKQLNINDKHFVFPSTSNVYEPCNKIINEFSLIKPINDYSISKVTGEHLVNMYSKYFSASILRLFNYTGINQDTKFLIPKIVTHFLNKKPVIELGDTSISRDFSDVRDVVKIYERVIHNKLSGVFNVCSGKAYSINDIISICMEISNHTLEVKINNSFLRDNEIKTIIGSKELLDNSIGALKRFEFDETLEWMLKN